MLESRLPDNPSDTSFPRLFSPINLRDVEIPNRIVFSAHAVLLNDAQLPTERLLDYYAARARGGVGLIVFEIAYVHPMKAFDTGPFISMHKPGCMDMCARIVDAAHAHGTIMFQQLADAGRQKFGQETLEPIMGPSAIPWQVGGEVPRAMTKADIDEMIDAFATAASLSMEAGFDGIELHGAHGYLLQQFLSRASNQRDDEYGGPIENRVRFPLELIAAVRETVGPRVPITMRIDSEEFVSDGVTLDEAIDFARLLTAPGQLDSLTVSGGSFASGQSRIVPPMYRPHGTYAAAARAIREVVDVPVVAVGRITDPELAEALLEGETADQVVMTRALIADPELPKKSRTRRVAEIRHCLGANECIGRVHHNFRVACVFNPEAGEEAKYRRGGEYGSPDSEARRVLVVGGGPAGCEAACRAARAGHEVQLIEQQRELGGQINLAAIPPGRDEFLEVPRYYADELKRLEVDVTLGRRAELDVVLATEPDHVIVATGSVPAVPPAVHTAREASRDWLAIDVRRALTEKLDFGDNVVVYIETRFLQGLVTADFIATQGHQVRIVVRNSAFAQQIDDTTRQVLLRRLAEHGIAMSFRHQLRELDSEAGRATFTDLGTREPVHLDEVTALVYDCGVESDTRIADALAETGARVHTIGDCVTPRNMVGAVKDGARVIHRLD
jgi:2,4-dienoyl-CoA reductase-like NADH-dependent reductase (Old Yellow Enzyme family)